MHKKKGAVIMLKFEKKITLTGQSMIDGTIAEGYQAVIDSADPNNMNMTSWQANKALYKEHRAQCRQDECEFEEAAYALQDALIAEKEAAEEQVEA